MNLAQFKLKYTKFLLKFTSPYKLRSVNSNLTSGVLETELVKSSPISVELHLPYPGAALLLVWSLILLQLTCFCPVPSPSPPDSARPQKVCGCGAPQEPAGRSRAELRSSGAEQSSPERRDDVVVRRGQVVGGARSKAGGAARKAGVRVTILVIHL